MMDISKQRSRITMCRAITVQLYLLEGCNIHLTTNGLFFFHNLKRNFKSTHIIVWLKDGALFDLIWKLTSNNFLNIQEIISSGSLFFSSNFLLFLSFQLSHRKKKGKILPKILIWSLPMNCEHYWNILHFQEATEKAIQKLTQKKSPNIYYFQRIVSKKVLNTFLLWVHQITLAFRSPNFLTSSSNFIEFFQSFRENIEICFRIRLDHIRSKKIRTRWKHLSN